MGLPSRSRLQDFLLAYLSQDYVGTSDFPRTYSISGKPFSRRLIEYAKMLFLLLQYCNYYNLVIFSSICRDGAC
jgi:hypothetical protein